MSHRQTTRRSRTRNPRKLESSESLAATVCLQIVDACLLGVIFIAPLFFGGRHPIGRFVFIAIASTAAIAWFLHQSLVNRATWTASKAYLLGIGSLLLVTFQLVALPLSWIEWLSPRSGALLTLWTSDASQSVQLGDWPTLSLTPSSTKVALAMLVAYVLLFITTVGRLKSLHDIERLLRLIATSAIFMGGFGLLQYFTSNSKFFWFYEHPYTTTDVVVKGAFSCRNHFAHFLILGMGPLLAWIVLRLQDNKQKDNRQESKARIEQVCLYLGLILLTFSALLSFSRGGVVAMAVASSIGIFIYYRRGLVSGSFLFGFATLGILLVGMLSIYGYERLASRLDDLTAGSIDQLDRNGGRRKIWAANLAAAKQGSLFGAGAGSHREIYPIYLPESWEREYTHAENGPLQIATECGFLGVALLALTILSIARWCWQAIRQAISIRQLVAAVAVSSGLAASLVHSLVDFVWFIPACMSLTILLASCALRLAQLSASDEVQTKTYKPCSRLSWCGLALTASLAAIWALSVTIGPARAGIHWDRFLIASQAQKVNVLKQGDSLDTSSPSEADQRLFSEAAIFNLKHTLALDPDSARANLRLAGKYLHLFDIRQRESGNSMPIDQIRDAVITSQFNSASELRQWLQQAFGDNSELLYQAYGHTHKALRLCPLQGNGYLYLANLCFLNGQDKKAIDAYVAQSLKVRPYDGHVLFEAGRQALLQSRVEEALDTWNLVFLDEGPHQLQIVKLLAGNFPASFFLETFKPNWQTLSLVWQRYNQVGSEEDRQFIVRYAELSAERECPKFTSDRAALAWRNLSRMQQSLGEQDNALASLKRAFDSSPNEYYVRREYGRVLLESHQYRLAEPHLRWCFSRHPDDDKLHEELVKASNGSLAQMANAPDDRRKRFSH